MKNRSMVRWLFLGCCGLLAMSPALAQDSPASTRHMIVVVGAEGTSEYGAMFKTWATLWTELGKQAELKVTLIGSESGSAASDVDQPDVDQLRETLERLTEQPPSSDQPHWLILIGHGTFQANVAKFNLRGPDVSAAQLADWLKPIESTLAIVNASSSSGPFVNSLSGPGRVIVTATKSGEEQNFTRFGAHLPQALGDPASDLDHDDEVSLLEAVLKASSATGEFYAAEGRIQTEHAILDDNADKLGTPAEMLGSVLRGNPLKAASSAKSTSPPPKLDGDVAAKTILIPSSTAPPLLPEELKERNLLETDLADLRRKKATMEEDAYFAELEKKMLELARLYSEAEKRQAENSDPTD